MKFKLITAWGLLVLLIFACFSLTYLKFFSITTPEVTETPINNSSSNAIHNALNDIVINFNNDEKIKKYEEANGVQLAAVVNNFSIFISCISEKTVTYEFLYEDLFLNITLNNDKMENAYFDSVYKFLVDAIQKRINNNLTYENTINQILESKENVSYDGISKIVDNKNVKYQINITTKLKDN